MINNNNNIRLQSVKTCSVVNKKCNEKAME